VQVTSRFPDVHGAPVHIGDPSLIGIADLQQPDYGDAVEVMPDELPVFWACGVTPQAAIRQARPAFCITHAPGAMLITDLLNTSLPAFNSRSLPMKKLMFCLTALPVAGQRARPRPSGTCPRATAPTPSRRRTCSSSPTR
jgi:hypothetical protein